MIQKSIFDNQFQLIGDSDTLDLDPRAFSKRLDIIEMNDLNTGKVKKEKIDENEKTKKASFVQTRLRKYSNSENFGDSFTFTEETFNQFLLITIKNVSSKNENIGYLAISENINDVKVAINERKNFIIRTAIVVGIVILIFSFVYFYKFV